MDASAADAKVAMDKRKQTQEQTYLRSLRAYREMKPIAQQQLEPVKAVRFEQELAVGVLLVDTVCSLTGHRTPIYPHTTSARRQP